MFNSKDFTLAVQNSLIVYALGSFSITDNFESQWYKCCKFPLWKLELTRWFWIRLCKLLWTWAPYLLLRVIFCPPRALCTPVLSITSSSFPTEQIFYQYNNHSCLNKQKQYPTLPYPSCMTKSNAECFMHWLVLPKGLA